MAIPEAQLVTWSHQGAVAGSSTTYNKIKSVLEDPYAAHSGKAYEVFLQGSYGNDTNIFAESDVDVVISLGDCFFSDLTNLSEQQKTSWQQSYSDAAYTHIDFKNDVLNVLTSEFGNSVKAGDKAIVIAPGGNRRKADVIVSVQYRRYYQFNGMANQVYEEGICFFNGAGDCIANYPKQHSANLTKKNQQSGGWLKPMVRVLKNLRGKLVADGILAAGVAPSYYLEGLLYNVPSEKFTTNFQNCFVNALTWLQQQPDKSKLVCANEQYYLLWENSHTSWEPAACDAFIGAAIDLWNHW